MTEAGMCVECAAKRQEEQALEDRATGRAVDRRNRWYDSGNYEPVWWGTRDPYWNDTDYRWYDDPNDDDDGGGFSDS
jgi:hypothetical protein